MKAYEDAGYIRIDEASLAALPIPVPDNEELPLAGESSAGAGHEADLVEQLRNIRDSHRQGRITDMEYRRRSEELIDQL